MKMIFENSGGGYLFPNLTLTDENQRQIGVCGTRNKQYVKLNHRVLYYNILTICSLTIILQTLKKE